MTTPSVGQSQRVTEQSQSRLEAGAVQSVRATKSALTADDCRAKLPAAPAGLLWAYKSSSKSNPPIHNFELVRGRVGLQEQIFTNAGAATAAKKLPAAPPGFAWEPTKSGSRPGQMQAFTLGLAKPTQKPADALKNVPSELSYYDFKLSPDGKQLIADPGAPELARTRGIGATRSISVKDTAKGGKAIELSGGEYKGAQWITASFKDMVTDPAKLAQLKDQKYDLDVPRPFLAVIGKNDTETTLLAFSKDPTNRGVVGLCSEVSFHDFKADQGGAWGGGGGGGGAITVRKPVIYLYPATKTAMTVQVELDGEFVAQYPKADRGTWRVMADATGTLFDPKTERRYAYLFWEGTQPKGFEVDLDRAHCVARHEVETFLERAAGRFGLNDKERTDFVSYWLPHLEKNKHSVVQFLDERAYERYARMTVTPALDTTIRLFMIFKAVDAPVKCGNPELPLKLRKGSCVVEWGGANLDERA